MSQAETWALCSTEPMKRTSDEDSKFGNSGRFSVTSLYTMLAKSALNWLGLGEPGCRIH